MASQAEIAKHLFLTSQRISQLQAEGLFPAGATLDLAREAYIARLRDRRAGITDERARFDAARAEKTELEVALMRGELVRREDVVETWAERISACRSALRAIPKHLVVVVPGFTRSMGVVALEMIDEVLKELSGDGAPSRRRGRLRRERG